MFGHKIINQNALHFLTFTIVDWIPVFDYPSCSKIIVENLQYCIKCKMLRLYAYVIMPNHLHLICKTEAGQNLSGFIRDFKNYTSKLIMREVQYSKNIPRNVLNQFISYRLKNRKCVTNQVWFHGNKPIELYSANWISQKLNYIHNNPVKAGLVESPEQFVLSSATNYITGKGLLDVILIDLGDDTGFIDV